MRVDVGWERSEPISITVKTPISNVSACDNSHEDKKRNRSKRFRLTKIIYMNLKSFAETIASSKSVSDYEEANERQLIINKRNNFLGNPFMRITELIIENNQIDEISLKGIGQGLSKAADAVGGAVGGVQGQWAGMQNVYNQKRDRVAAVAQRNAEQAGGYKKPAAPVVAPTPIAAVPPTAPAANAVPNSGTMSINGNKLDPKNPADAKIIAQIQAQDAHNATQQAAPQPSATAAPSAPPRRLVGPKGVAAVEKAYKSLPDPQRSQARQSIAAIDAGVKESLTVGYKSNFLGLVI